ncbi:septum formation initiator family protein [Oenococcus sp. UCMA 16435]|nr:septum formation initiator family protein [Oenococcus sp. UCMA 16435]MDI4584437.1 septum formation initiator family protein [Oenococcus sp. UCMA 14587]
MATNTARQHKRFVKKEESNRPNLHLVQPSTAAQIRTAQAYNKVREKHYHKEIARRRRLIACVGAFLFIFFSYNLFSSATKLYTASSQLNQVNQQLAKTKTEHKQLKENLKRLKQSDYLTQYLRDKYQYSKSGEVIFNFTKSTNKK